MPEINVWAVIVAAVSTMAVGAGFYTPAVFGRRWMRLVGHTDESVQGGSPWVYPAVLVASAVTAAVLAGVSWYVHEVRGGSFLAVTLVVGIVLWLGFTATRVLVHDLFDTRPLQLTLLTALHELITVVVMALIIGVWPPSGV